jgi:glutaminase
VISGAPIAGEVYASATDLGQQYLCSGMTAEEPAAINHSGERRRFAAGALVIRAGETAESMYFIFSGEVEVWVDPGSNHRLRVTTLGPGTVFGEVALASRKRRTANISAAKDTDCLEVRFDAIQDAVRIKMLANMAISFAAKIEHATQLIRQLA